MNLEETLARLVAAGWDTSRLVVTGTPTEQRITGIVVRASRNPIVRWASRSRLSVSVTRSA